MIWCVERFVFIMLNNFYFLPNSPFFLSRYFFSILIVLSLKPLFKSQFLFYNSEAFTIKLTPRSVRSTKTVENHKIKKIPPLKPSEMDEGLFDEEFGGKDDFNEIKTLRESERYLDYLSFFNHWVRNLISNF